MAQPKRNDVGPNPAPQPWSAPTGYRAGGEVGQMHADLARRLDRHLSPAERTPGERAIRFVSVAGGVTLLAAAYLGVALLLWL
jgi:hypothetical protein